MAVCSKSINWKQSYARAVLHRVIYITTVSFVAAAAAGGVWEWAGPKYQCSLSQKMECHCGEQEGSGCQ